MIVKLAVSKKIPQDLSRGAFLFLPDQTYTPWELGYYLDRDQALKFQPNLPEVKVNQGTKSMPETNPKLSRATDFKFLPVDAIGFSFNDNGCKLTLGVEDPAGGICEQVTAVMSLQTTKLLWFILNEATTRYESRSGVEIQLDPVKAESLRTIFNEADKKTTVVA